MSGPYKKQLYDDEAKAMIARASAEPVFTTGQIAKLCKVAPRTVSKWFDAGSLVGYRIPGSNDRRVTRSALHKFLVETGMTVQARAVCPSRILIVGVDDQRAAALRRGWPPATEVSATLDAFSAGLAFSEGPWPIVVCEFASTPEPVAQAAAAVRRMTQKGTTLIAILGEDQTDAVLPRGVRFDAVLKRPFDGDALAELLNLALGVGRAA